MSVESTGARLLDCAKVVLKAQYPEPIPEVVWNVGLYQRECWCVIQDPGTGRFLTKFSISWIPECPKVVIFHSVSVDFASRNKGLGTKYHNIRLDIARMFGAKTVICTINSSNVVEKRILQKFGWQFVANVNPPDTELWSKQL